MRGSCCARSWIEEGGVCEGMLGGRRRCARMDGLGEIEGWFGKGIVAGGIVSDARLSRVLVTSLWLSCELID